MTTKGFGSEISWSLDTCQSEGPYGSNNNYIEQCCLAPGAYNLTCLDSYGDGWNGGKIEIQGNAYCKDFTTGGTLTKKVNITTGKVTKVYTDTHTYILLLHIVYSEDSIIIFFLRSLKVASLMEWLQMVQLKVLVQVPLMCVLLLELV